MAAARRWERSSAFAGCGGEGVLLKLVTKDRGVFGPPKKEHPGKQRKVHFFFATVAVFRGSTIDGN